MVHYIAPDFVSKANGSNSYRNASIYDKANLQSLAKMTGTSWNETDRKRETELVFGMSSKEKAEKRKNHLTKNLSYSYFFYLDALRLCLLYHHLI